MIDLKNSVFSSLSLSHWLWIYVPLYVNKPAVMLDFEKLDVYKKAKRLILQSAN
jgi:hypothetical protein